MTGERNNPLEQNGTYSYEEDLWDALGAIQT
jgi:hypothetical protein